MTDCFSFDDKTVRLLHSEEALAFKFTELPLTNILTTEQAFERMILARTDYGRR